MAFWAPPYRGVHPLAGELDHGLLLLQEDGATAQTHRLRRSRGGDTGETTPRGAQHPPSPCLSFPISPLGTSAGQSLTPSQRLLQVAVAVPGARHVVSSTVKLNSCRCRRSPDWERGQRVSGTCGTTVPNAQPQNGPEPAQKGATSSSEMGQTQPQAGWAPSLQGVRPSAKTGQIQPQNRPDLAPKQAGFSPKTGQILRRPGPVLLAGWRNSALTQPGWSWASRSCRT